MSNRAQYDDDTKTIVSRKYGLCKSPEDRDMLAKEANIESRQKLYNLASRLFATKPHVGSPGEYIEQSDYNAKFDVERLYLRDDPLTLEWSSEEERYICDHFGKTDIESIGYFLNKTETAVAYHARRMGLRNIPKYYDINKVAPWLGLTKREVLVLLTKNGLEIFPCTDKNGKLKITLVSTSSLARVLIKNYLWKTLIEKRNADKFFIKDIIESVIALQKEETNWEFNCWVSHGHTCLNPFSDICFGMFYTKPDDDMAGEDLEPRDLAPGANVQSDSWRRGMIRNPVEEDEIEDTEENFENFDSSEVDNY